MKDEVKTKELSAFYSSLSFPFILSRVLTYFLISSQFFFGNLIVDFALSNFFKGDTGWLVLERIQFNARAGAALKLFAALRGHNDHAVLRTHQLFVEGFLLNIIGFIDGFRRIVFHKAVKRSHSNAELFRLRRTFRKCLQHASDQRALTFAARPLGVHN